jgi:hypothetical protein
MRLALDCRHVAFANVDLHLFSATPKLARADSDAAPSARPVYTRGGIAPPAAHSPTPSEA